MFTGIFDPAFLQSACAHVAPEPQGNKTIYRFSNAQYRVNYNSSSDLIVKIIKGGVPTTYEAPQSETGRLDIEADANTDIIIYGDVLSLSFNLSTDAGKAIFFDASKNNVFEYLTYGCSQGNIELLALPASTKHPVVLNNATNISTIKYPATNSDVATKLADLITNSSVDNGTLYTDSAGAYYSTLETAATAKGWTIEQL